MIEGAALNSTISKTDKYMSGPFAMNNSDCAWLSEVAEPIFQLCHGSARV